MGGRGGRGAGVEVGRKGVRRVAGFFLGVWGEGAEGGAKGGAGWGRGRRGEVVGGLGEEERDVRTLGFESEINKAVTEDGVHR